MLFCCRKQEIVRRCGHIRDLNGESMEYRTVRETAEKWRISERLVQKYCAQGRIEGARKFGVSWGIPSNAVRPEDPRKIKTPEGSETAMASAEENETGNRFHGCEKLMPLMSADFKPGHCREYIRAMEEGSIRGIASAEYYYFSGQPEKAIQQAAKFLDSPDQEIRLSAGLIVAYANLSVGRIGHARHALGELKRTLAEDGGASEETDVAGAFAAAVASVLLHLPLPDGLPPSDRFLPVLPPGLQAFALYVQAHYLYLQEMYEKSLGVTEAAFSIGAQKYPIPAIYLHLVAVMDHISLRDKENAEKHLLAAWEMARPDDLIEAFGEHHGLLGGMLESVIKTDWPDDFKRIIDITYRFSAGWRRIHNPDTGEDVADNLTTTEFAAAMLAARGWTNQEIGEQMNISSNTVKRHLSVAMQKLGINRRQDLKQYMLR